MTFLMTALIMLFGITIDAQIKNAKTDTVKIAGNCGMCKATIEKAGNVKKIAQVAWNQGLKQAILTYDVQQTNRSEILKRIALAGYDSDEFLAPDDTYASLPTCCQYERTNKSAGKVEVEKMGMARHEHENQHPSPQNKAQETNLLTAVFEAYFALKDALVNTNSEMASSMSNNLLTAINAVKVEALKMEEQVVWMEKMKDLEADAKRIADTKDVANQRLYFRTLSENMHALIKVAKPNTPVYYQFCPMANDGKGANWLSKESGIKNPYYGSQMLSCGKTVETIE